GICRLRGRALLWRYGNSFQMKRRPVGKDLTQHLNGDVMDGDITLGFSKGTAVMRVAMEDRGHRITIERFFKPATAEERINLQRLTFHRVLNRSVMQQYDALVCSQARQRRLELEGLIERLAHETLDSFLAPRGQHALAEAAAKSFGAGEADAL